MRVGLQLLPNAPLLTRACSLAGVMEEQQLLAQRLQVMMQQQQQHQQQQQQQQQQPVTRDAGTRFTS